MPHLPRPRGRRPEGGEVMPLKECPECGKASLDLDPARRVWRCLYITQCGYVSEPEPTPEQRIRELGRRLIERATERDAAQQELARYREALDYITKQGPDENGTYMEDLSEGELLAVIRHIVGKALIALGGEQHGP